MKTLSAVLVALLGAPGGLTQDYSLTVPSSLMTTVGDLLPEASSAGAAFVSGTYSPNLVIEQNATVDVVFLWEGAGYRNTLGWFTYQDNPDGSVTIGESALILPNASFPPQGNLYTGAGCHLRDTAGNIRTFVPGERVGFFLVADGWGLEPLVQDFTSGSIPSNDPQVNAGFGRGCYTSLDKLNPEVTGGALELARHLAMIWMPGETGFLNGEAFLLSGFEDLRRDAPGCDNDFNDLVFLVDATPIQAIRTTPAFNYLPGDPDGDLVIGVADHYPNDPTRAFVSRLPPTSERVIGCEDRYPWIGDADYNDVVLAYHLDTVTDRDGRVKDLMLTMHLVARGATYEHRVGWHIPGLPSDATGTVSIERIASDPATPPVVEPLRQLAEVIGTQQRRVPDLFPLTSVSLPAPPGNLLTNTYNVAIDRPAASVRVRMTFDSPVDPAVLGTAPYDVYVAVLHDDEEWDIHMPGYQGFPERPGYLPAASGPGAFLDEDGNPWMLQLATNWRFPMERIPIWAAYPSFSEWVASAGSQSSDWYLNPSTIPGRLGLPLLDYVPTRTWSVELPPR